jgi:predicted ribosomally synthesized peptide with SipW-like signal peptide
MADDDATFELSRRKALAGLGTIGVASAGAGLGTSAFFSDTETFTDNQLTAGELDLKVDWEEHYSDWSDDEANLDDDDDSNDLDVQMSDPGSGYTALPDPMNPLIWVANGDLDAFMDNTAIEAYPDTNDDGVQDPFNSGQVGDFCTDGADTPEDLDPTGGTGLRTNNDDTYDSSTGTVKPLVNLDDVKPGDFGEVTFSFHICDNPGYVWLQGSPVTAAENGNTEPEANDGDESGDDDESYDVDDGDSIQDILDSDVELLDEVQTTWWYDDGDNVLGGGTGTATNEVDVMIVFDRSGSMTSQTNKFQNAKDGAKALVDSLGGGAEVGLVSFSNNGTPDESLGTDRSTVKSTIDGLSAVGQTNIGDAISDAQDELSNNGRAGADKVMVVLSNGGQNTGSLDPRDEADDAKTAGTRIISIAYGSGANENLMEDISSPQKVDDGTIDSQDENAFFGDVGTIQDVFDDIGTIIVSLGEEVIFRGSLRDALDALSTDHGIPLDGDLATPFDEITDPDDADARECFQGNSTNYIGFAWYLPVDHANEIQGDSVSFDLGFYTEQCRHNDGAGQAPEGSA